MNDKHVVRFHVYEDKDSNPLYRTIKFDDESWGVEHITDKGEWEPGLRGIEPVPYRLPYILDADELWLTEGEKDADTLAELDQETTSLPFGTHKWRVTYAPYFRGKMVNVVQDNDDPGIKGARRVVKELLDIGCTVRLWKPPEKFNDVTDSNGELDLVEEFEPELGGWNLVWGNGQSNGVIPTPSILRFKDDVDLLYKSKINGLFGPSEVGKTWVAMQAVREVLDNGGTVAYYDFEDDRSSIEGRLKSMGVDGEALKRFGYQSPSRPLKRGEMLPVAPVDLAVFDGATELFAVFDKSTNEGTDLAFIENLLLKPWADAGAAVVIIHHAPHEGDRPLGTQHFKSMISGAAYMCKLGSDAKTTIYIYKDRNRGVRKHFPKWARSIGRLVVEESSVVPDGKRVFFEAWPEE